MVFARHVIGVSQCAGLLWTCSAYRAQHRQFVGVQLGDGHQCLRWLGPPRLRILALASVSMLWTVP